MRLLAYQMNICVLKLLEGAVAQSVECATPDEELPGSSPAVAARYLLVGLMSE